MGKCEGRIGKEKTKESNPFNQQQAIELESVPSTAVAPAFISSPPLRASPLSSAVQNANPFYNISPVVGTSTEDTILHHTSNDPNSFAGQNLNGPLRKLESSRDFIAPSFNPAHSIHYPAHKAIGNSNGMEKAFGVIPRMTHNPGSKSYPSVSNTVNGEDMQTPRTISIHSDTALHRYPDSSEYGHDQSGVSLWNSGTSPSQIIPVTNPSSPERKRPNSDTTTNPSIIQRTTPPPRWEVIDACKWREGESPMIPDQQPIPELEDRDYVRY
jgi:hypothetical protein